MTRRKFFSRMTAHILSSKRFFLCQPRRVTRFMWGFSAAECKHRALAQRDRSLNPDTYHLCIVFSPQRKKPPSDRSSKTRKPTSAKKILRQNSPQKASPAGLSRRALLVPFTQRFVICYIPNFHSENPSFPVENPLRPIFTVHFTVHSGCFHSCIPLQKVRKTGNSVYFRFA